MICRSIWSTRTRFPPPPKPLIRRTAAMIRNPC
nr:MAG TPA: hypothetical protein [Caudoviricetes sp.]